MAEDNKERILEFLKNESNREKHFSMLGLKEAFNKKKLKALKKIPSFERWSRWRENRGKSRRDYEAMVSERISKIGDIRKFLKRWVKNFTEGNITVF